MLICSAYNLKFNPTIIHLYMYTCRKMLNRHKFLLNLPTHPNNQKIK